MSAKILHVCKDMICHSTKWFWWQPRWLTKQLRKLRRPKVLALLWASPLPQLPPEAEQHGAGQSAARPRKRKGKRRREQPWRNLEAGGPGSASLYNCRMTNNFGMLWLALRNVVSLQAQFLRRRVTPGWSPRRPGRSAGPGIYKGMEPRSVWKNNTKS